eukprot:CAMPEP_0116913340 /NCGR_PEP_ID=MMETSP0467-20121206/16642_1 /TAXON_ID=283647 /ORGANISM="Mesodinium pulex, Strain SPMC105" /LENGTH=165 /DNA_ID=CAMNT_0004589529 /DNA_START=170 /DNA_END=668 /DNA_ORIENTATION=+
MITLLDFLLLSSEDDFHALGLLQFEDACGLFDGSDLSQSEFLLDLERQDSLGDADLGLGGQEVLVGVALSWLLGLLGEHDQVLGVVLEAVHVGGEGVLVEVAAAGIDCDSDRAGLVHIEFDGLEFGGGEAAAQTLAVVVPACHATDDGAQVVKRSRRKFFRLLLS